MSSFMKRHQLAIVILVILLIWAGLFLARPASGYAAPDPVWDKSTLSATGQCLAGGILRVTVTNGGADMQGPVTYGFLYAGPIAPHGGTLQLRAGESIIIDSLGVPDIKIEFWVYQRPGHPGTGIVHVRLTCGPNAVTLTEFSAGGYWKWTPGCIFPYPWGRWTSNVSICHRFQLPITYRWVWVPR